VSAAQVTASNLSTDATAALKEAKSLSAAASQASFEADEKSEAAAERVAEASRKESVVRGQAERLEGFMVARASSYLSNAMRDWMRGSMRGSYEIWKENMQCEAIIARNRSQVEENERHQTMANAERESERSVLHKALEDERRRGIFIKFEATVRYISKGDLSMRIGMWRAGVTRRRLELTRQLDHQKELVKASMKREVSLKNILEELSLETTSLRQHIKALKKEVQDEKDINIEVQNLAVERLRS